MYNAALLQTAFANLVGWRQNPDPLGWQLTDLMTSSSGLFFNDVHPMLTIENLASIAPEFDLIEATDGARDIAFNLWLKQKTEAALLQVVDSWFADKSEVLTARNLLSRNDLFNVTGNITEVEVLTSGVVGLEVVPARSKSVVVTVERIGIQLDTNQTFFIKLFQSGVLGEVQSVEVVYTGSGAVQWVDVNWSLDGEGAYYILYDQSALFGNYINGIQDFTFDNAGMIAFPTGRFFGATAFSSSEADFAELWDLSTNEYTLATNYGLNMTTNVQCDYTSFLISQKDLFKTALSYQVGMNLLRELAFNPNSKVNRNESNITRSQILFEIDGDTQGRSDFSVMSKLKAVLKSIQFDESSIDKLCLPCRKKGVRYTSIGAM